jgi:type VI secretion system ImpM family protein
MTPIEYLAVGCFGKLPCEREYLEVNVSLPSSQAFRAWIRAGRNAAGMSPESADGAVSPETNRLRCLFAPPGAGDALAAVIRPSADLQGRTFPFAVFVHVSRRPWARAAHLLPLALDPVWEALDDVWASLSSVASVPAFREVMASSRIRGPLGLADAKAAYEGGQGSVTERLFGRGDGASLEALRAQMPGLLKELRANPDAVRVELPAGAEVSESAFDATFWIDLINRQFFWRRFDPSVFVDGAPKAAARRAFLIFGPVAPEDYPGLMGLEGAVGTSARPAHAQVPAGDAPPAQPGPVPTYAELVATRFMA